MANRLFRQKMFGCVFCAVLLIFFAGSAWGAEMTTQQQETLQHAEELLKQLNTEANTEQGKLTLALQILQMTEQLGREAKEEGNTELAEKTADITDKVAVALFAVMEGLSFPTDSALLQRCLEVAETASRSASDIAEMARDTKNSNLGQSVMPTVTHLKQVYHVLKVNTQYAVKAGEDMESIQAGKELWGRIEHAEFINENAYQAAIAAGAKPQMLPGTADQAPKWWKDKDLPLDDTRIAIPLDDEQPASGI